MPINYTKISIKKYNMNHQLSPQINSKITQIQFDKPIPKVLCVSTAYNNTFLMVRIDKPCQTQSIVHFDQQGNILYQRNYNDIIEMFGQMSDREVIVLDVPHSNIDIINLETKTVKHINHKYLYQDTAQMHIYNFSESGLFCIQEKGTFNDNRLMLTYYSYHNLHENSQPVAIYMAQNLQWTYDHVIFKGNEHSKIIWFTYKHEQTITFTYFDLKDHPQGKLSTVSAVNNIGIPYGIANIQLNIGGIWEMQKDKYMVVATSNKCAKNSQGVINNNYVVDTTQGNDKATIRQTNFCFDVEQDGFCYNNQVIDFFGAGKISVFHTFRHNKGQSLYTPIYYVNNQTEEIIGRSGWKSTCYASNFYFPGHKANTYIQAQHQNGDVQSIKIKEITYIDPNNAAPPQLQAMEQDKLSNVD